MFIPVTLIKIVELTGATILIPFSIFKAKPDPATLLALILNIFKLGSTPVKVRVPKLTFPVPFGDSPPQKTLAHSKYACAAVKSIGVPVIKAPFGLPMV